MQPVVYIVTNHRHGVLYIGITSDLGGFLWGLGYLRFWRVGFWVPACAGMTKGRAGMTKGRAGMTKGRAGMTKGRAGMTKGRAGMTG